MAYMGQAEGTNSAAEKKSRGYASELNAADIDNSILNSNTIKLTITKPQNKPLGGSTKRFLDFVVAVALVFFLAPLLVCVWFAVRLDSKGAALFRQQRGGFGGQPFQIYKFRTMRVHDEVFQQASREDKRITRIGRLLRKTSLDELPQLFNVIKGDMSLVGPRPHVLEHDKEFLDFDERYALRFKAKPGVTGLAQVSGSRGPTDTDKLKSERISWDLKYVNTWSLWQDVSVLIKTACLVFFDKKAF